MTETSRSKSLPELRRHRLHGREMAVRVAGAGPVVVLLHGIMGSSANWAGVLPALAEQAIEVFENVGHRPHWGATDRFAQVLGDFLRSTEPAAFTEERWRELFR